MILELLKRQLRLSEARLTRKVSRVSFSSMEFRFLKSMFWDDTSQEVFEHEIVPYFQVLVSQKPIECMVDAGAATGQFAIVAAKIFPGATVHVFEPSLRQRVLLQRNLELNGVTPQVKIFPHGLWKSSGELAFRTHGAISSLEEVGTLPANLAFDEKVHVATLDEWAAEHKIRRVDIIKMDIEGAEIEALEGARHLLSHSRPDILLQAYHIRNGRRTFEPCAAFLEGLGYQIVEVRSGSGFLHATCPDTR